MNYGGYSTACENFSYGEVEDYPIELSYSKLSSGQITKLIDYKLLQDDDSFSNKERFAIYPNPASDYISISDTRINNLEVKIYNSIGTQVKTTTINNNKRNINVSDLASGFYTISFKIGQKIITKRFIKY